MDGSDITVVFQGPIVPGSQGTADLIRRTQQALPRSRYVLSTWTGSELSDISVDTVVLSDDPGGLPGIKCRDGAGESNNINRQLLSTQQGLRATRTRYAIKIRTDCFLEHTGFLETYQRVRCKSPASRIVASSLFTVDPEMFEQMPYHVSDWFQFGETEVLHAYWSAPCMSPQDATFYERHPHAGHSTFMDRRFRTRLAVEQYLAVHYAQRHGYDVPQYHNDCHEAILAGHRHFLARHFIILDPWDIGLRFPKYEWAYRSSFQQLNCLLFVDWYRLYLEEGGVPIAGAPRLGACQLRQSQKRVARTLGRWLDVAGPWLVRPGFKQIVNRILSVLAWQSRRPDPLSVVWHSRP